MSKFFKALKITAITALCAVGMMSLSGCENYGKMLRDTPDEYIDMAMENTMESMGGNTFAEEKKLLEKALEDGSFSLGFEVEGITFNGVCEVSEKANAVSQMYTLSNAEGNSAQVYVYADEGGFKFGTIGDSGSHIYDVTLEGFAEKLAASIFAPDSDSAYAMSETDYNEILQYVETLSSAMKNADAKGDDKYQKLFDDFKKNLDPAIEEKTDIEIGGETVSANTVTYTVSTDKIKELLNKLFDLLAEDGQLNPDTTGYSEEEMKAQFDEAMASIGEIYVTAEYDINAKTNMLMQSDIFLNVTADGEKLSIRFKSFFGADPASAEKQTYTFGMNADGENIEIVMDVIHTENSAKVIANMTSGGENMELFTINTEKNGDNYSLSVNIMDEITAGIEGTVSTSGNNFDMTIDKISAGYGSGEFSYSPKAKVNVKKGGEISVLDAEGEFLGITEEEMDALLENISGDFGWLAGQTSGALTSSMIGYVAQADVTYANSNAKEVFTACSAYLAKLAAEGEELNPKAAIGGNGAGFVINEKEADLTDYLGDEFTGYSFGYMNDNYTMRYIVWSEEPITDAYRVQLSEDEQKNLADRGVLIGCYPFK